MATVLGPTWSRELCPWCRLASRCQTRPGASNVRLLGFLGLKLAGPTSLTPDPGRLLLAASVGVRRWSIKPIATFFPIPRCLALSAYRPEKCLKGVAP